MATTVKRQIRRTQHGGCCGQYQLVRVRRWGYYKTWWESRCQCGRLAPAA
ncbi:MAG: hypothetical protein IT364_12135 [Candidatus Hydrogenedentes bacterium]|nr:hypothetical protein [Candidatus Hydrogenedentota bacterium]